jgi:hypothetical protein
MLNRLVPIIILAAFVLAGCQETSSDTSKDVADARKDAQENVQEAREEKDRVVARTSEDVAAARRTYSDSADDARSKLTAVEAEAMIKTAHADYDIASAQANGRAEIEKQKCGALTGVRRDACLSSAEARLQADLAEIAATRDAVLVSAENRVARRD